MWALRSIFSRQGSSGPEGVVRGAVSWLRSSSPMSSGISAAEPAFSEVCWLEGFQARLCHSRVRDLHLVWMTACSDIHLWAQTPKLKRLFSEKKRQTLHARVKVRVCECILTLNGLSGMLASPQETITVCFTGLRGVQVYVLLLLSLTWTSTELTSPSCAEDKGL